MPVLLVVWEFLKKNWQAALLVIVFIIGFVWIQRQQADAAAVIQKMNDSHQVELEKITLARAKEEADHAVQLKQLKESIDKIQANYEAAQQELERQKLAQRKDIVKKYSNDVDGLAQLTADKLGLQVVPSGTP